MTEKKVVKVKPIERSSWLGKGHDGSFMFTGTFATLVLPLRQDTGKFNTILTKEEQAYFEEEFGLDKNSLNFNNRKNEFWSNYKVRLSKEERALDLSDPNDLLTYKFLLRHPNISPSWKERFDNPDFKWALVDANDEVKEEAKQSNKKGKAYKFLGKVEDDNKKMRDLLKVLGKNPGPTASKEFMVTEVTKFIEDPVKIDVLLSLVEDENYDMKLLIEDAIECGSIVRDGLKYRLGSSDGDLLGVTRQEVIDFLKLKKNQPIYDRIKAQIEIAKEKK